MHIDSVSWLGSWERNSLFLCPGISTFNIYRRAWKCVLNQCTVAITLENPRASTSWKTLLFGVSFKWLGFVLTLNEVSLRPEECLRSPGATVKGTCESTGGMVCMREVTHAVQSGASSFVLGDSWFNSYQYTCGHFYSLNLGALLVTSSLAFFSPRSRSESPRNC